MAHQLTPALCVYCGSRPGALPEFQLAAQRVGEAVGRLGARLVYGGGRLGLMGVVATAALAAGARVTGIIPRSLMEREVGYTEISELHVVETMHERKQWMARESSAFIALPGGMGTLEELFEVWTWQYLGYHDKPMGLLNVAGYFDPLLKFLDHSVDQGFVSQEQRDLLIVGDHPETLVAHLLSVSSVTPPQSGHYSEI